MHLYQPLLNFLDRMGYGGIVLGPDNRMMSSNPKATSLMQELAEDKQRPAIDDARLCAALRGPCELALDEKWIALTRPDQAKRPILVLVAPTNDQREPGPAKIMVMVDLETGPAVNPCALRDLFGLTSAESRIATAVASGKDPRQIADLTHVSVATVRKQLAAVFAKTRTRRQSELNVLVNRLSILP